MQNTHNSYKYQNGMCIVDLPKVKTSLTYIAIGLVTEKGDGLSLSMLHK